jgi:hypothetical protein
METNLEPPKTMKLGVSRPPLEVVDLPTPEEVFKVKRIGLEELILYVAGPSLIALGVSIGSGEWITGPLNVGTYGWKGIGWVILISALLQVFYNVELGRFTVATGETPILAFGRVPPGAFVWVPLALICFYVAFILGGWTTTAGSSLFVLINGRPSNVDEIEIVRILGIGLLATAFLFFLFGKKVERSLEASQGVFLAFILTGLVIVTAVVVPFSYWKTALVSLITPALPPKGSDPSLLGSLAGFTALASGLNFMFINYYRDKGYGMGYRVGFIPGARARNPVKISPVGKIFPEDEKNAALWKRWFRYLLFDQWVIYFIGVLIGMVTPSILVGYLLTLPGSQLPSQSGMVLFAAEQLGARYGSVMYGWALLMGFIILYTTQIVILDLLARNLTDGLYGVSAGFRKLIGGDSRKFYYPILLILIVAISVIIHAESPEFLLTYSANLSNLASLIFPILLMYLNSKLPKPAKIKWWSYVVLFLNVLFFGFFFANFLTLQITGHPLVYF